MAYVERPTMVPEAVLWQRTVPVGEERSRILPDGCMDLLWDGRRLVIAGPDTTARWHSSRAGTEYVALRFSGGTGPARLGVPADVVRDQCPDLEDVWGSAPARELSERVADDPGAALEAWAVGAASRGRDDPLGAHVFALAAAASPVADIADVTGLSVRQLHRRCLVAFGYGPKHLARVLRLGRAVEQARSGRTWVEIAVACGYADQAHLSREVRSLTGTTPTELLTGEESTSFDAAQ